MCLSFVIMVDVKYVIVFLVERMTFVIFTK